VVVDDAIPDAEFLGSHSTGDLGALEDAHRDTYSDLGAKSAAMYVLYVKGQSDLDSAQGVVIGLAYRGGSVALFLDNAETLGNVLFSPEDYEAYTLVHEAGHLLGLVNWGLPMVTPHEDEGHPGHDVDPGCVMFWAVNDGPLAPHLGQSNFATFNVECVLDVQAFGGL
jgi:hypothetical protein